MRQDKKQIPTKKEYYRNPDKRERMKEGDIELISPSRKYKSNELSLYLAHPVLSRKKIRKWELEFESAFGINLINPFYDDTSIIEKEVIKRIDAGNPAKYSKKESFQLVRKDLELIRNSTGLLAILDNINTIGTIMEIVYASIIFEKPVFTIAPDKVRLNKDFPQIANHPWVQYHSIETFKSLSSFENYVERGNLEHALHR